jgi:Rubisco LSMT substrate-binding
LNHYRPRETKWTFDEDLQAFTITSLQHICPGSQVYDSYGQKCNHRFLLNYGFAVEDNRELDGFCPNEVPLELYVDPEDPLFYEKLEFWTRGESSSSQSGSSMSASVAAMAAMHATNTMTASFLASHITSSCQYQQQQQNQQQQNQQQYPYQHHNHHESIDNVMAQPPVVKRVRVCVSNNENTRLLFSLLRALACNAQELRAIRGGGNGGITLSPTAKSNNNHSSFFQQPTSSTSSAMGALAAEAAHFRQNHNSGAAAASSIPLSLSSSPPSSSPWTLSSSHAAPYHRSCRDIRHPISIRNERAAMRLLLEIIGRHLAAYPTTLSQDMADLMDEEAFPPFSNLRHAKIQVRGEKQVLHHFALWARTALDVLDVIEEELKEERGSVEVKLTRNGRTVTEERPGFDYIIRRMEDDCDREHNNHYSLHHQQHNNEHNNVNIHAIGGPNGNAGPPVHHTILRYCADVLGSLRREETKHIKRQRAAAVSHHHHQQQQQQHSHQQQHYYPHGGSPQRSNITGGSASGGSAGHANSNSMGQGSHGNMHSTSPPEQQQQQYRHYHHYNVSNNSSTNPRVQQQQPSGHQHINGHNNGANAGDRSGSNRPYGGGGSPSSGYM